MKKFEETELKLLEMFLENRVTHLRKKEDFIDDIGKSNSKKSGGFSIGTNVELLNKVKSRISWRYSSLELSIFNSCVNEVMPALERKVVLLNSDKWFSLTVTEIELMYSIDTCANILERTGFYKKYGRDGRDPDFSFKKIIEVLGKIKGSTKILIDKTSEGEVYKMAFVFNDKEILKLKPDGRLHISNLAFTTLQDVTANEYAKDRYSIITDREEATLTLKNSHVHFFDENVKGVIFAMLN